MPKFDKDVFECLIDKVVIGEIEEKGRFRKEKHQNLVVKVKVIA